MKVKDYKIVWGLHETVEKKVKELLSQGWVLSGGVSWSGDDQGHRYFTQAMIQQELEPLNMVFTNNIADIPFVDGFKVVDPPKSQERRDLMKGEDIQASGGARTRHKNIEQDFTSPQGLIK
jgi:hypothetical protein